jgi:hypothetical protein
MVNIPLCVFIGCAGIFLTVCVYASLRPPKLHRYFNDEETEKSGKVVIPPQVSIDINNFQNYVPSSLSLTPSKNTYVNILTPLSDVSSAGSYFIARL